MASPWDGDGVYGVEQEDVDDAIDTLGFVAEELEAVSEFCRRRSEEMAFLADNVPTYTKSQQRAARVISRFYQRRARRFTELSARTEQLLAIAGERRG